MLAIMAIVEGGISTKNSEGHTIIYPPYHIIKTDATESFSVPPGMTLGVGAREHLRLLLYWSPDSGLLSFPADPPSEKRYLAPDYKWLEERQEIAAYLAHEWVSWIKAKQHSEDTATEKEAALFEGKQGAD